MKTTITNRGLTSLALAMLLAGLFTATPLPAAENAKAPAVSVPHDKARELPVIERVPAASWVNVKTDVEPRAVGDGKADDTTALQAGLDKLNGGGGNATVLYLPPGTYRITDTLVMAKAGRVPGNMMIGHGAATRIVWDGRTEHLGSAEPATSLAALRQNPNFPDKPETDEMRSPAFVGIAEALKWELKLGDNYGERLQGWIRAPQTGNYTFLVAGDDQCEVRLSSSAKPDDAKVICRVPGWTPPRQWTVSPEQTSKPISLQEGQFYYVEILHKEAGGGAHVALGWQLPDGTKELPMPISRMFAGPKADAKNAYRYQFWRDVEPKLSRMFQSKGASESSYSGIVFDGNGKARVGVHEEGDFKTALDWEYCAFINCTEAGVRMGMQRPFATSETIYRHCVFASNATGLAILDFNYYNIVVDECVLRGNGTGVLATRFGQAYVRNSRFEASRERDLSLGDSHKHAVRRCVSTGSRTFIEGTHFTVQDCLVSGWTNPGGAIIVRSPATPVLIFDCVFKDPPAKDAPIRAHAGARMLLSNNTSPGTDRVIEGGIIVEVPAGKLGGSVSQAGLALSFTPPLAPSRLFDAVQDFNGDVQATIDAAREHGKGAVAYFPARGYSVKETIKVHGADCTIRGDGYQTQFKWEGPAGGTVFHVEDPQNLTLDHFQVATYGQERRDMLCIRQTSTGKPSSITYNKVMAGSHGAIYRADGATQVRGIEFRGLGRDSRVYVTRATGSAAFIDSAAADILLRFWNGGPIVVENPGKTPRTGFLGGLNANHVWELVVRDSLDVVFTEYYKEQGEYGFIQLYGSPEDPPGRVTLGATRLHLWKKSPFFARIDGYRGQLTYATANVTWDNSPDTYTVRQTSASPFTLVMLGHDRFRFDIQLDPSARLVRAANNGVDDAIPAGGLDAISAALDHWRLLGQKDVEFRKWEAGK